MKSLILIAISLLTVSSSPVDASMMGLKVGSPESAVTKLTLKQVANSGGTTKFTTTNDNDFVVTVEDGKVVYMENDWNQKPESATSLLGGFSFGQTSLKEIRKRFETKGFVYAHNQNLVTKEYLYEFHCFEVESPNNEVLVVVTKIPFSTNVTENTDIAAKLKLDALVLATPDYLEYLWGEQKSYSEGYHKIRL